MNSQGIYFVAMNLKNRLSELIVNLRNIYIEGQVKDRRGVSRNNTARKRIKIGIKSSTTQSSSLV